MRRLWTRSYNVANGQANREFAAGRFHTVAEGPSVKGRGDVLLTYQARFTGTGTAVVRFVRVYPNGGRDGTGDMTFSLDGSQSWLVHQHVLARKNFTVEVQIRCSDTFVVDYNYLKATV